MRQNAFWRLGNTYCKHNKIAVALENKRTWILLYNEKWCKCSLKPSSVQRNGEGVQFCKDISFVSLFSLFVFLNLFDYVVLVVQETTRSHWRCFLKQGVLESYLSVKLIYAEGVKDTIKSCFSYRHTVF